MTGQSELGGREAAARACSVAAFGAYWLAEQLCRSACWLTTRGDGALEAAQGWRPKRCGCCATVLVGLATSVDGIGFCSTHCYRRATSRPSRRCAGCDSIVYLKYAPALGRYRNICNQCMCAVEWAAPSEFPTETRNQP